MRNNYVLLLTGCINPKGMSYTALNDMQLRKKLYVEAIRFYLQSTTFPIIFCENTLSEITKEDIGIPIQNDRFEYITFDGNNFDKCLGKGYGECEIIEYTYKHSYLIKNAKYIVKITGRIIVPNIITIIKSHNRLPMLTISAVIPSKESAIDSRIVISPKDFYPKHFIPLNYRLNDSKGYYFEHLLNDSILAQKEFYYIPFILYPHLKGISGTLAIPLSPYSRLHSLYYKKKACLYILKARFDDTTKKIPLYIIFDAFINLIDAQIQLIVRKIIRIITNDHSV